MLILNNVGYVHHAMEDTFQEDEWDEYGMNNDHLVSCISLGDNFAMNSEDGNEKEVDFTSCCAQRRSSLSNNISSVHGWTILPKMG